jgi:hypothetical protein
MVDMLDYHYHYALMATEDRLRQHRTSRVLQLPKLGRRDRSRRRGR